MKNNHLNFVKKYVQIVLPLLLVVCSQVLSAQVNFSQSTLNLDGLTTINGATAMEFGPDGRLYVSDYSGTSASSGVIKALTIQRNSPTDYVVTAVELLTGAALVPNHNDDGTLSSALNGRRQVTGLTVAGTAANPVVYVTSSDIRIGGGTGTGQKDSGLDTNSGVITRMTWMGGVWEVVDIVRGLPRSEENHATNGLDLVNINGTDYLIVATGGFTNAGGPSSNFALITEYALGGAVLSVNLSQINQLTVQNDNGRSYIYDLPTLDDPTRANVNGITDPDTPGYNGLDINDPWGGNDGLNQAKIVSGGPVQIFSPGYRNAYDLVVTESGSLYVTDNGANGGWGGFPVGEGTANATNDYDPSEPGSQVASGGELIDNIDHLELVTTNIQNYIPGSFYGGHPNPQRANPAGAGLYTDNNSVLGVTGSPVWRTLVYDPDGSTPGSTTDASIGLPVDWPPVPVTMANAVEGDWRGPTVPNPDGPNDNPIVVWGTNTNGITEYTASNFGDAMKGNLLATHSTGNIRRVELLPDGTSQQLTSSFLSTGGGFLLGVTTNDDTEVFPGTIWTGSLSGPITVFEPQDFLACLQPGDANYDALADYDGDGYTNQDEIDNGTDICNGGSAPNDFDKVLGAPLVSDLNDLDDDGDTIADAVDPFQLGDPLATGSDAFAIPIFNDLFNDQQGFGGIFGLGMTGLMNNGDTGANWINWLDRRDDPNDPNPNDVLGGAPGIMTSHMTSGTSFGTANNQEKGYQYGVQVDATSGLFTVIGGMNGFTGPLRLYGNTAAVGGELGFFIGDGTQSNYIKFVVTGTGFTVLQEIADVPQAPITVPLNIVDRPTSDIVFYFVVNPSTGAVDLEYSIDGGARVSVGSLTAQGEILNALQLANKDLAVGFSGTSGTAGVELEGSWDFLNVAGNVPVVAQQLPDLTRFVNAIPEDIDLSTSFTDDNGVQNLTYTVENNTNPNIGALINGSTLTLSYPSTVQNASITIRATDADTNFVEQSFLVSVTDSPIVLYRVNAGGAQITAIDGGINWSADTVTNNSAFLSNAGTNQSFVSSISSLTTDVNTATTPFGIFNSERFDASVGSPNMTYSFPVPMSGNYEVRLYMGNSFSGTAAPGQRIFNVTLEGELYPDLNQLDLSEAYGHEIGTVITYVVPVNDGVLDISFLHTAFENPLVNGIEILDVPNTETPIYPYDIPNQLSNAGQPLNGSLTVQALGGDGNLSYAATGLPNGVFIESTNGVIGGTIDPNALAGSPYNVTITIDDSDGISTDEVEVSFQWNVVEAFAYRINAGGNQIMASGDIGPRWENNATSGAQNEGVYDVNTGISAGYPNITFDNRDSSIPAYINETTFFELFGSERYDLLAQPEMIYNLPLENGDYVVNLYFGNGYVPTATVGSRVFDILVEGNVVQNDWDLIAEFGNEVAGMLSYPVVVTDGNLNISFAHVIENPVINGIEVFNVDTANPVLALASINNISNDVLDVVSIPTNAVGGDPNASISYYISGQPEGITIDVSTGEISGTISSNALTGGPNGNGVHNVTVSVLKPNSAPSSQVFTWTMNAGPLFWTDYDEDENYTARHENSFVQAGDKFYLMGGRESATTIDVYDYASDSWNSLVDSAPFEFNHFQATEYQGLIWVIGSFKDNAFPTETPAEFVWAFDPANEEWIQGPQIPTNRRRGSAGLVMHNNKFYVVAGNTLGHNGGYVPYFDEFDPATGVWTTLTDAPRARDHFSAVVIGDELYVSGGRLSGGPGGTFAPTIAEVDVYDFISQTWTTLPAGQNIPTPRGGSSAVNFNEKLVVIGGETETAGPALTTVEEYDPLAQSWSTLAGLNSPRHGTQAIVSGNGIFILSGSPVQGGGSQKNMEYFGDNAPVGSPSVASELNSLGGLLIADGATESIDLNVENGNVGVVITSMVLSGDNANDFSIVSGELANQLLNPNTTHPVEIALSGTGANRNAILTINYGNNSSKEINLSNAVDVPEVTDPGTQNNNEGDIVSLQIDAIVACTGETYSANGLPPGLAIDADTGLITGTVSAGGGGNGAYQESNGLVVIEMENLNYGNNWSEQTSEAGFTGTGYLFNSVDSFNTPGNGTISTQIEITTPGLYRFQWYNKIGIIAPSVPTTEHNDAWLRFDDADDFYGAKNTDGSGSIVYPKGLGKTPVVEGASSAGWLKVYTNTIAWNWNSNTSDNDAHFVFVEFDNPGTYTMEIASRSDGHLIDRATLHKVDQNYTTTQLLAATESSQGGGSNGAADGSPYTVEVTVADNCVPSQSTVLEFVWNIGEAGNQVPVAVAEADITTGDAPLTVSFTGSNSTDDVGVTGYLWDFNDGTPTVITADPIHEFSTPGSYEVTLTVSDGVLTNTSIITITVNAPANLAPVVTNPGLQNGVDGDVVSLQVTATDPEDDVLTYSATGLPTGLSIDTATGLISGTIANGASTNSPYDVDITVTDNGTPSEFTTVSFTWNVTDAPVNQAPVVTNPGLQNGVDGDVVSLQVTATDAEDDVLTYSATGLPTGLSIDTATGLISGTIANGASTNSPYDVDVTVTDNGTPSESTTVSFMWNVTDVPVNQAPVVTNPGLQNGVDGDVVSLQVTATDPEDDVLTYSATGLPTGLSIDTATGLISGTIANGASTNSPYAVDITVTDNGTPSESTTVSFMWNVTDVPVNQAPVVTNPGLQNGVDGDVVSLQVTATDPEDDVLTYSATGLPTGLSIDTATGLISGTIANGASTNSPYAVDITVTDNGTPSESTTVSFMWNVTDVPVNQAPVAIATADLLSGPSPLTVNFTGSDSTDDNGIISYLWDFATGEVSTLENPTYIFEMQGTYEVTLTVEDEEGLQDSIAITIEVDDNILPENPDENSIIIAPNPAGNSTEVWIDLIDDTDVLGVYIYDLSGRLVQKNDLIGINSSIGSYSVNTSNLQNGVYTIYVFISGESKPLVSKLVVQH